MKILATTAAAFFFLGCALVGMSRNAEYVPGTPTYGCGAVFAFVVAGIAAAAAADKEK